MQVMSALPDRFKTDEKKTSNYLKIIFTIIFSILNIFFIFFDSSPGAVMGFTGAVVGFFIAYFFPTWIKILIHRRNLNKYPVERSQDFASLITE